MSLPLDFSDGTRFAISFNTLALDLLYLDIARHALALGESLRLNNSGPFTSCATTQDLTQPVTLTPFESAARNFSSIPLFRL